MVVLIMLILNSTLGTPRRRWRNKREWGKGKGANIHALNENSVFSLHFLTDVVKKKLISIKHAKRWYT